MLKTLALRTVVLAIATTAISSVASAQLTTFSGWDLGASAPGANSISARNAFVLATGGTVTQDFESTAPNNMTVTGGIRRTGGAVRGGPCNLFGCNTTPGGNSFHDLYEFGATRLDFATPINYFGAFFGGMQLTGSSIRVFLSGGTQDIPFAFDPSQAGTGFYGFSSTEKVSRVDVIINSDYVGMDDVIAGSSNVVPEPSTYALMAAGLVALGVAARRRRTLA